MTRTKRGGLDTLDRVHYGELTPDHPRLVLVVTSVCPGPWRHVTKSKSINLQNSGDTWACLGRGAGGPPHLMLLSLWSVLTVITLASCHHAFLMLDLTEVGLSEAQPSVTVYTLVRLTGRVWLEPVCGVTSWSPGPGHHDPATARAHTSQHCMARRIKIAHPGHN